MPESFDFVTADPGSGGANLAGDTFTQGGDSLFLPGCYLVYGPAGGPYTRVDSGDGLPVEIQGTVPVSGTFWQATQPVSIASTLTVTGAGGTFPVTDSGGSLTVDGTVAATQSGTWTVTGAGGTFPVTDGGGSLTVDGTVGITGSVTVTGGLTNTELRSTAVVVDGSGVTQPVSGTFWQATQPVSASNLDIRDLAYSTDSITAVQGGSWSVSVSGTPTVVVSGPVAVTGTFWQATQPVSVASTVTVTGAGGTFPVTDSGGSLTVDGTVAATQSGTWTVTGAGGTFPVTDGGGSLTVDGTVAISGSVAVTGGLTNTELRSSAVVVDGSGVTQPVSGTFWQATQPVSAASLPLPSGASTAAKQPALGTAGTASADVLTVQGIASMTALKVDGSAVTQPVSGTVTVVDGGGSITVDGTVAVSSVGGSVAVTGTFWQATQPVSGPLTNTELRSADVPVSGTFWQATQPVSVASTVTVTGAGGTFPVTDSGGSLTVDGTVAATQSGTWAVSGPEAKDAAATANPLYLAGYGSTATPSSVSADGDITPLWVTRYGALWVVDVGAGISATPSDAYSAGSMPPHMSFGMLFNGATWDRARSVNTGQAKATLYDPSGNVIFPTPAALADGASNPTTVLLGSCESLWNGSTWDRRQGKEYATILASGTRNATTTTSTVTSRTAQGVIVYLNVTAYPGGGNTLNILLRSYDPVTNNVTTAYTSAASAIAAVGTYTFELCPGAGTTHPTTGCGRSPQPLPYKWDVAVVHATGAGNWTYSVNYQLVP